MTFLEKYREAKTWSDKALIMEIYHLAMNARELGWTIGKTATDFQVSIGLVSENLKLANAIHKNDSILKCETRQDALKRIMR